MCVTSYQEQQGFTLIELSIVLVIIGLIVGGVLVGQDLIRAAYIRAQISQIERFNAAKNTFYGKYQALPGDMNASTVVSYGFSTAIHNGGGVGQGDGDGLITGGGLTGCGFTGLTGNICSYVYAGGETGVFWSDLSSTIAGNLIEGSFVTATEATAAAISGTAMSLYMPAAKLGGGNYVYISQINGVNYYGIDIPQYFVPMMVGVPGITVAQAYSLDKKLDDGNPTTGTVVAVNTAVVPVWSAAGTPETYVPANSLFSGIVSTAGNAASSSTCFDAPTVGGPTNYSMEINHGAGLNCALLFEFQ